MNESILEDKSRMLQYSINGSIFLGLFWVFKYVIGILGNDNGILNFINGALAVVTPIILFNFLVRYNNKYVDNNMSFGHGIQLSILMFFFASIFEAVVVFIHVNWIDTAFIANLYGSLVEIAQSINLSEALVTQLANQPLPSTFSYVFSNVIMADVFIGLLLSLLIVPFARRYKPIK